jgi:hypothetical protein
MRSVLALVVFAVVLPAAPVPKGVKKPPSADGVWECVEFNGHNGKVRSATVIGTFWQMEGEELWSGKRTVAELTPDSQPLVLAIRDPKRPHQRELVSGGGRASADIEVDGDPLRWALATDWTKTITECGPADDVYYYVFKRVKEK